MTLSIFSIPANFCHHEVLIISKITRINFLTVALTAAYEPRTINPYLCRPYVEVHGI
jgi:hypothetical protein